MWADKHLRTLNTSNLEVERLQKQRFTSGYTPVSKEHEYEAQNWTLDMKDQACTQCS